MAKKVSKKRVSKSSKVGKVAKTKDVCNMGSKCCTGGPGIYCLGFIGAAVYNVHVAVGFWMSVWGVIKALVWPAFLVFKLMKFLNM